MPGTFTLPKIYLWRNWPYLHLFITHRWLCTCF